jgi:hypothetical protein
MPYRILDKKTYDFNLLAVLSFGDLRRTLFIKIGALNLVLKLAQFGRLGADLLDLPILLLFVHLHTCHLSGKVFLHQGHRYLTVASDHTWSIGDTEVGGG